MVCFSEIQQFPDLLENVSREIFVLKAIALLEKRLEKFQTLSGIQTHDFCVTVTMLFQLSYKSHMRAIVHGYYNNNNHLLVFQYIDGTT